MILKQSTVWARKFLMILSSDHITRATGKSPTVKLSKGPGGSGVANYAGSAAISELDPVNMPGWYQVALAPPDTNTIGDLAYTCTAAGCDSTIFIDQVQTTVPADMVLSSGRFGINAGLVQNQPFAAFTFLMVDATTGAPKTGLAITSQVSLAGAGFVATHNTAMELSNGLYTIAFINSDLNANMIMARFTASGAVDLDIGLIPSP